MNKNFGMENINFILYRVKLSDYEELSKAFNEFEFSDKSYYCEGKIKKQTGGSCKYGEVKIIVETNGDSYSKMLSWEVSNDEIPIEYLDVIATTLKAISKDDNRSLKFRIVGGSHHVVDSTYFSFEIATFSAISNLVGLDKTKVQ